MTAINFQVGQKLYKTAVDQWQQYEEYLGPIISLIEN